jgi:UDP-N-acetylglucosamine--N-acetylmuramyl-(pentapeptide) pyrophosphoryl-undecaprenol N-acetylglucosamine transferase
MSDRKKRLVVAGGGTGGHVLAGIAVADEWRKRYGSESVIFVGARGGIEERLVPRAAYPLKLLNLGSLKNVSMATRLKTVLQLPIALLLSKLWLLQERPEAILGVGGYASGPFVLMGKLLGWTWGARVAILEQNAVPGLTNRILARFSDIIFSAFPGLESHFSSKKLIFSGNPVRKEIQENAPLVEGEPVLFVFGGSQGAQAINTWMIESLQRFERELPNLRIIHQTGERDFVRVADAYRAAKYQSARVEPFIYDMHECYRQASLLVCRAGSSTLSEVAAVGRASILIPFPFAADNHQEKNARVFERAGAAVVLTQRGNDSQTFAEQVIRLLKEEREQLVSMAKHAYQLHRPNCSGVIVDRLDGTSQPTST